MGRYGNGVAAHTERTEEEEESTQGETIEEDREEREREREGQRANLAGADEAFNRAPSAMKGVFVGDACVYNAAGGYYVGEVEKGKIRMGLKQVKQGEKGKYGEIIGRELTGKFVASTAPIYIWMRKDGTLELISGRHRFAKAMEDGEVKSVMCYVFREDAKHNELWAELLDYENNLRDDQADERTAAYYVRKFPQTDEELRAKGLLRNGTVAKRGIFIGRYARENLYNMWMSTDPRLPLGRATNIEEICRMTKDIKDVSRIEDIQSTAARLLSEGESWEYINGMIHMMAQDRTAELRQGLLDMGTDYTQNLERAARYIEKVVKDLEAGIKQIKDFMANKGMARGSSARKRAKSAEAVGLDAGNLKYPEEKLAALTEAAEQWKMVGNYPELVSEAYMWDGETEVEKAGRICSRVEEEQDAAVEAGERARAQAEVPEGQGEMSFSAEEARERGMMKDGVMVAGNGVVVAPGVDFSAAVEGAQHASPYLFREFDTAHMGEGEGNQAYGWGLYFSTDWGVNRSYWNQFSGREPEIRMGNGSVIRGKDRYQELVDEFLEGREIGYDAMRYVRRNIGDWVRQGNYNEGRKRLEKQLEEYGDIPGWWGEETRKKWEESLKRTEATIEVLKFLEEWDVREESGNAVDYLVDLDAEEHELLPWDGKIAGVLDRNRVLWEGLLEKRIAEAASEGYFGAEAERRYAVRQLEVDRTIRGEELYVWLMRKEGGMKAASEWLAAHGVKGIKYEDYPSRKRGVKTYNYVVFDGGDVKIRKINNRGAWTSDVGAEQWENFSAAITDVRNEKLDVDEDGEVRLHGVKGVEEEAMRNALEQARANIPVLKRIAAAAARKVGAAAKMRPANPEDGQETKAPKVAWDKAAREYGKDVTRVIDLIGGTLEIASDRDFKPAVEAIKEVLPGEGCKVARVKVLGAKSTVPCYQDVKVSIRFANGGVGEMIVVTEFMNEAKFNGGGHLVYEIARVLVPFQDTDPAIKEVVDALNALSAEIYSPGATAESLARAYAFASSALQGRPWEKLKALLSSRDMTRVKSSTSGSNVNQPDSVNSAAIPSSSEILKLMAKLSVAIKGRISKLKIKENGKKLNGEGWTSSVEEVRNMGAVHEIGVRQLLDAEELGGMPVPSVAVTRLDKPYRWGKENRTVTLVGRPEMIDPRRGARVYARDAWTGRVPEIDTLRYDETYEENPEDPDMGMYFLGLSGEDGEREVTEATLENLTEYMRETKRRGSEASAADRPAMQVVRALTAQRLRDMEEVKGQREKLEREDGYDVGVNDLLKLDYILEDEYEVGLGNKEWYGVFEAVADLEEVNEESVREALEGWTDADGRVNLWELQNSGALEEGSEWVKKLVEVVNRLRSEARDYLEATPLRAVKLGEWRYALVSKGMYEEDREEVRALCERNGIEYREYERGYRDEALAELVGSDVSFSVEEAEGRGMFGGNGVMVASNGFVARPGVDFSAAIEGLQHATPYKFKEFSLDFTRKGEGALAYGYGIYLSENWEINKWYFKKLGGYNTLNDLDAEEREILDWWQTPIDHVGDEADLSLGQFNTREALETILDYKFGEKEGFREIVREIHDALQDTAYEQAYYDFCELFDVDEIENLDDDELDMEEYDWEQFEWYAGAYVNACMTGEEIYNRLSENFGGVETMTEQNDDGARMASEWLKEHGIKAVRYEDAASRDGDEDNATYNYVVFDTSAIKMTHINESGKWSEYEEGNPDWVRVEVMTDEELSSAVVGIDDRVMGILRARDAEEAMGARIAAEWGKFARAVSLSTASGDEWRAEDGARLMGKMLGLVAATRRFLPEEYGVARGMHQMIAWAKWYAQVLESGEVKRTDMLRGDIYEKALAGMRREVEGMRGRLTPGEVEGWLRGQMGQRLDVMLLKMAGICRGQVERYEKEQIRRRMMDMAERLYPKMEPGEHIKRGKATADTYRYIEKVVRTVRGDMWWRSGAAAAEMEAALQAKLARVDLDPKVREVVERELAELRSKEWQSVEDEIEARERVVDNAEDIYTDEQVAEAREVIHVLQTYGNWRRMGIEECRKAYEEFRQVVVEGKRKWEAALERRKSELEYVKKKVRAVKGWKSGVVNERVGENAKKASEGKDVVKLTAMALTTFTGKLQAAKRKLGGYFVERETNAIAEMHRELKLKSDEAHNWVLEQLVKCSGERTQAGVEDWLRRMNEIEDTGILLKLKERHVYSITKEKLGEWARMPREKWAEEIARRQAVAAAEERVDTEIPTEEALEELVPELVNDEVRGGRKDSARGGGAAGGKEEGESGDAPGVKVARAGVGEGVP